MADFADPLLFLVLRFLFAGAILAMLAAIVRAEWPRGGPAKLHALASGVLLHTGYLGGVWWSIEHGLSASFSALIAALQPLLTAAFAPILLGERLTWRRLLGVGLGFVGLCLTLEPRLAAATGSGADSPWFLVGINCLAMASATAGTFYQKRFVREGDLRTVAVLQYVGAVAAMIPCALLFGDLHFQWSLFAWGVMAWAVIAISIGAIVLLLLLIREGEVVRASQLLFLVPPVAHCRPWSCLATSSRRSSGSA